MKRITLLTLTLILSAVPIFWVSASGTVVRKDKKLGLELIEKVKSGSINDIKLLIEKGADVNTGTRFGWTALIWACRNGRTKVAELLIEKGAEPDKPHICGDSPLKWACRNGHIEVVKLLIEKGADLDKQDFSGNTALMIACRNHHTDIAKQLIENGADMDKQDNKGNTGLIWACRSRSGRANKIAELLIEKGADLDKQNNDGNTALIFVCMTGNTKVAKLLIEKGPDLNIQNKYGNTALIYACMNSLTEIAKLLIEEGADLDIQNNNGDTALIRACKNGSPEICKALLSHAIILPELTIGKDKFKANFLLVLKKAFNDRFPKDIRVLIASKLELKQLLYFANIKGYWDLFKEAFLAKVDEIAEYTIKALIPMMVKARNLEGVTQELKDLLNPEHYEENFGEPLRNNIKKVIKARELHLFVRLPKDSSSEMQSL